MHTVDTWYPTRQDDSWTVLGTCGIGTDRDTSATTTVVARLDWRRLQPATVAERRLSTCKSRVAKVMFLPQGTRGERKRRRWRSTTVAVPFFSLLRNQRVSMVYLLDRLHENAEAGRNENGAIVQRVSNVNST